MTREEAITYLKVIWNRYKAEYEIERETLDAYHMAIEALSVANLKEEFEPAVPNCQKCAIKELWEETEKEDLVAVVRCKDCRHYEDGMIGYCGELERGVSEDFYCYYGERGEK